MAFQREILQYAKAAKTDFLVLAADEPYNIHERICQVIKGKTTKTMKEGEQQQTTIEYFEAVRIAYLKNTRYFIEYFGDDDITYDKINKNRVNK
jgi:CHAD domain-containing protein